MFQDLSLNRSHDNLLVNFNLVIEPIQYHKIIRIELGYILVKCGQQKQFMYSKGGLNTCINPHQMGAMPTAP